METDRTLRRESFGGTLLIVGNGIWIMTHWHQPATHVADFLVALATVGAVVVLRAEWKRLKRRSS